MLRKHSTICRTVSMLSRLRLCLCPSLPTSLFINAVYSSALMEAAEFILKTHKFLPHYTVFLIIVPVRASVLIMSKFPSCVHKKKANLLTTYLLTPWSRVLLEKLTGFAVNQEIPRILWNPKVHYRTHKRPAT